MAITDGRVKAVAKCLGCGAIVGAEIADDGSITPLGSTDECACGNATEFQRLR